MTVTATETIRKEIFVDAAPETAFRVFTEQTAAWWPLNKYGIFLEDAETVVFEDRDGWRLIEKAKDAGMHVAVWTVDDPAWIERARTLGIDALITNDPAKLKNVL